jgi:dTDP-4-dehydrorhamnose 3,5-epimerase
VRLQETSIRGLYVVEPKVFGDDRGFFTETYRDDLFKEAGLVTHWKQDNWSRSQKGVLRGLHFQTGIHAQAKLVRVISGAVFDAVVDLRPESPTYGKSFGIELNASNKKALYVPTGFAHGFQCLADNTDFLYKCSEPYAPHSEGGYMWNDPAFGIEWPLKTAPLISAKDLHYEPFRPRR